MLERYAYPQPLKNGIGGGYLLKFHECFDFSLDRASKHGNWGPSTRRSGGIFRQEFGEQPAGWRWPGRAQRLQHWQGVQTQTELGEGVLVFEYRTHFPGSRTSVTCGVFTILVVNQRFGLFVRAIHSGSEHMFSFCGAENELGTTKDRMTPLAMALS